MDDEEYNRMFHEEWMKNLWKKEDIDNMEKREEEKAKHSWMEDYLHVKVSERFSAKIELTIHGDILGVIKSLTEQGASFSVEEEAIYTFEDIIDYLKKEGFEIPKERIIYIEENDSTDEMLNFFKKNRTVYQIIYILKQKKIYISERIIRTYLENDLIPPPTKITMGKTTRSFYPKNIISRIEKIRLMQTEKRMTLKEIREEIE